MYLFNGLEIVSSLGDTKKKSALFYLLKISHKLIIVNLDLLNNIPASRRGIKKITLETVGFTLTKGEINMTFIKLLSIALETESATALMRTLVQLS